MEVAGCLRAAAFANCARSRSRPRAAERVGVGPLEPVRALALAARRPLGLGRARRLAVRRAGLGGAECGVV